MSVTLGAGTQQMTVLFDNGGMNFRFANVASSGGGGGLSQFSGTPVPLPGTVNAENFDNGGEGVAYHYSGGRHRASG
jgi:beta-glucosidase